MSFEEEFDRIIRRKAEEEQYPFDENNWDKTNRLLDAERKIQQVAKFKKFYLPAALVVAIGSAGLITFSLLDVKQSEAKIADSNVAGQQAGLSDKNTVIGPGMVSANSHIQSNENELAADLTKEAGASNQVLLKENNAPADAGTEIIASNTTNIDLGSSKITKAAVKEHTRPQAEPMQVSENAVAKENGFPVSKFTTTAKNDQGIISAKEIEKSSVLPENKETESSVAANNLSAGSEKTGAYSSPSPANNAGAVDFNIFNNSSEEVMQSEQLSAVYSTLPFEIADPDLMENSFTYLDRYDDEYYKKNRTPKTHYLNLEAGADYLLGWDAKRGKDGKGFNWYAGFNYGRYFSHKISLSLGLQAYNVTNISQPFYLVASKEYGFGSRNIYTRVTSNELFYIAVPLKFNYAVNSSNIIGFGINAGYLLSANNTVSKYYVRDNEEISVGSLQSHSSGIYKGTNMVNMMLSAHYKTSFGKRIGLNLEFNYGLTDIFKNTVAIKAGEKPLGVRVGLTYTLFDK